MDSKGKIFRDAEIDANKYSARCLIAVCIISIIIWVLNIIGFFVVDETIMNTAMPICIVALASPTILLKFFNIHGPWVKYYISICFVIGISILHIGMTYQVILAWACPILLSGHFYSKRVTKVTFITSLILLFVTIFMGALYGTWDCNMLDSTSIAGGSAKRMAYLLNQHSLGKDTLINIVKLYFIPRALILTVVYIISITLSKRTYALLDKQQAEFLEDERIGAELSVATEIQKSMLPNTFPPFPEKTEFELFASMSPSKEVGGDFYDFFLIDDDHLALVMADVSGKGVPAAMFMMATKIMIKNRTVLGKSPAKVLAEVNNELCETNENDMFVTVWFGIYEIKTGKLTASNAGHEYPILQRNSGEFEVFKDKHGFVIGGMENMKYSDYELTLEKGDTLFLYTDGVPEAVDKDNNAYGLDRLIAKLNQDKELSLDNMLLNIRDDVDKFAGNIPQFDDITMLSIRRNK